MEKIYTREELLSVAELIHHCQGGHNCWHGRCGAATLVGSDNAVARYYCQERCRYHSCSDKI